MATRSLRDELEESLGADYKVDRELGGGGMSRVFVATDAKLGRSVVIKVLPPELAADVSVERFRREIGLAARLQHPHIVPLLSAGELNGLPYFVMPLIEGESLREQLSARGEMPVAAGIRILREVASALAAAHQKGIVHRDIKPDNILLSGGSAMVTDFGVAKALNDATLAEGNGNALTEIGMTLGTAAYMSPEQAAASPNVDARTDIYAFGVMAYEMFTGRTPFGGRSPQATLAAHVIEPPEAVQKFRVALPAPVAALIMQCLEKHPADRPQTATEIVRALESASIETPVVAAANTERRRKNLFTTRRTLFAVGALALILVVAFAIKRRQSGTSLLSVLDSNPTVAVMPLFNGDTTIDYLAYGIADEVRRELTNSSQALRVASASSSNSFHGKEVDASEIGRKLHVAYAILGQMRRTPTGIYVTVELVNTSDNSSTTLGNFERSQMDVPFVADSIAHSVARLFKMEPNANTVTRVGSRGTTDSIAFDLYLRARFLIDKRGAEALKTGEALAEQAIARDPNFARAYAELGIARGLLPSYTGSNSDSGWAAALRAEDKAIALDSTLARAWAARGFWTQNYEWDQSERYLRKALTLDSKLGMAHKWLCQILAARGKVQEAVSECRTATQQDPLLAIMWEQYGLMLYFAGMDSLAIDAETRASDMDPLTVHALSIRAFAYARQHRNDLALHDLAERPAGLSLDLGDHGYLLAALGRRDTALTIVKLLESRTATDISAIPSIGLVYLGLGDKNLAIGYLIRAARAGVFTVATGGIASPQMDVLRTNVRYAELLRSMNLQNVAVAGLKAKSGS
ncbi:MAG: protein kinase [Gemmatimonadaceae bacterium]